MDSLARKAMFVARKALQTASSSSVSITRVTFYANPNATGAWTNQPGAEKLFLGTTRHLTMMDLSTFNKARLIVNKHNTAAATGATIELKYKTGAYSSNPADYSQIGSSPVSVAIDTTTTMLDSGWITLASGAKADSVILAITGKGGDGVKDPKFGIVAVDFK